MLRIARDFPRAFRGLAGGVLFAAVLLPVTGAQAAETLHIGGTGSALGSMQHLADAFMKERPDIKVVVLPSLGSGGGIKALIAGKVDMSVSARPLRPAEASAGLVEREYATTPLVFATRPDTDADGVTLDELTAAYGGETTTWPTGARLRLVMRPAAEADTAFLRALSPEMDEAVKAAIARNDLFVAINDQDNATALEDIRGSLGVISLGQLQSENRALKPLTIDGMTATPEALREGTYPYAKHLYIVVPEQPSQKAAAFLDFVASAEGSRILTEIGFLPSESAARPQM